MISKWLLAVGAALAAGLCGDSGLAAGVSGESDSAPQPTLDTDPHLVGWWKFDETTGKSAADASKQNHAGTLQGALSFDTNSAPGRSGKAVKFEGNNDCIRVTGYKGITNTNPRTVAVWIKTKTAGGDLATWGENEAGKMWIFGHIRGRVGVTPRGGYFYMKAGTDDDAWHHVAVVVKAASPPNLHDDVKLYKDGELAVIDDIGLLDMYPIETGCQQDVTIGRRFKGLMDDLRLYDRALSGEEIRALFKLDTNRPLSKTK
jgi:hypothetical protein